MTDLAGVSIITLAVEDIPASVVFYESLGWENSSHSQESIAFLQGHNVALALYGNESVEEEFGEAHEPNEFPNVTLAVNFSDQDRVDQFYRTAMDAGAEAIRKPDQTFWGGYSGYFRDPDGHMWEAAHNPFVPFKDNGQLDLLGAKA